MTVVVHCLKAWQHYLLASKFEVQKDNMANTYFKTQKDTRSQEDPMAGLFGGVQLSMDHKLASTTKSRMH